MKPNDDLERLVRQLKYRARPEFRRAVHEEMLAELGEAATSEPQSLWGLLITSRVARYATAASVAAVGLAAVIFLFGLPGGRNGVALAEVLEKTDAMNTVVIREERAFYRTGEDRPSVQAHAIKYISTDLGQVEECYSADGQPIYLAYFLKKEKRVVVIFPAAKGYLDLRLTDKLAALSDDVTPQGIVRLLTRHGSSDLGRAEFDDQEAQGFEASQESIHSVLAAFLEYKEVSLVLFPIKGAAARLWVSMDTALPVGVEAEIETGRGLFTGFQEGTARFRAYSFQWGAEIDPKIFVAKVPADYRRWDLKSMSK
jgi:hypothetical protein